ncbi:MAG: hypothetical protein DYG98_09935 [Haliscomenobacteraceae bacterium CHB4]|nr:hypothetical protein [Haliscomenobacteraceae bacterium CHB4]
MKKTIEIPAKTRHFPTFHRNSIHFKNPVLMLRFPAALTFALLFLLNACDQEAKKQAAAAAARAAQDSVNWAAYRAGDWKNHGCDLISDDDVIALFGVDPQRDVLNTRTLPEQAFCLRTWNKPDWKERENANEKETATSYLDPQNSLIVQVFSYPSDEHARQQFESLKRDRRDTYDEDVPDLGEGALWSSTTVTLLVKKGHSMLSIALNYKDVPHDNLDKAREVAEVALRKM